MSIFEAGMLICFGASWPAAVYKTYKTKNVAGKSILFLFLILLGYSCGIMHKIMYNPDGVLYLYVLNFMLVFCDFLLYLRYQNPKDPVEPIVE